MPVLASQSLEVVVTIVRTKQRRSRHPMRQVPRRPLLIGLSGVTLGFAGLLFNLYQYVAGTLVLVTGGMIAGLAERRMRRVASVVADSPTEQGPRTNDTSTVEPVWSIPKPVQTFIGRSTELARLRRQLSRTSTSVAVAALHGMPGLGKTQLAMAYAERSRGNFEIGWWITASDRLWALAGLAELAQHLGVATEDHEHESAAQAVIATLERRRGWLLIFDDAADHSTLAGLIPNGPGQVVITSRNPAWGSVAVTNAVPALAERDAVKLLLAHSGDVDVPAATRLATELNGLPLAIAQAGTYCRFRAVTLAEYHERFLDGVARLMVEGDVSPYPAPVTVTVGLAVEQVRRKSVAAVQLLRMLAFLGPEAVPRDLSTCLPAALPSELAAASGDPLVLDSLVEILVGTSLVSLDRPGFIRTHGLVQGIIRATVSQSTRSPVKRLAHMAGSIRDRSGHWTEKRWVDSVGALLAHAFPEDPGDLRLWHRCVTLSPHVDSYINHATRTDSDPQILDAASNKLAAYLHDRGEYAAARTHFERCLAIRQRTLGTQHEDLFGPTYQLAQIAYRLGQFVNSELLFRQVAESTANVLGPEHPETLKAESQLSFVLTELGNLDQAKSIADRVHSIQLETLGPDHPDTLRTVQSLDAALSELTSDREEIIARFTYQVDRLRQRFGATHFHTARAAHNLYRAQAEAGHYAEAKSGLKEIISTMREVYGFRHPFLLYALHNLARAYWLEGVELERARLTFERTLVTREQVIGPDHPKTLTTRHYLARVLVALGERGAAETHLRLVADARALTLGHDNPHTLLTLDDIRRLTLSGTTSRHGMDAVRRFRPDLASSAEGTPEPLA
ncbi:tetratricopeptide repeat protein [Actinosynnema sp. NPDC023794]